MKREHRVAAILRASQQRSRHKALDKCAKVFQRMIRAEAAAHAAAEFWGGTRLVNIRLPLGVCCCVTCGRQLPWDNAASLGDHQMDTGHYVRSRRASIVLEETNAHPQCARCNRHMDGNPEAYEPFMVAVYGQEEVDRLKWLKDNVSVRLTLVELAERQVDYADRIKAAKSIISGG